MLLTTEHISKEFNGIYALRDINFSMDAGEIHGLVGENGAGKSTLIKLLTGVYKLREGRFLWDDKPVSIETPRDSQALGIHVIHQDRTLIPTFNCIENAYLGLDYPTRMGRVDWAAMTARVRDTMERLGINLNLKRTAAELSPPQRTELEIVRAMMQQCRLLILDEPTASLTDQETGRLFNLLRDLKEKGTAILYVTHRLDEITLLTDYVTVLRNGALVETVPTDTITREGLISRMTDNAPIHTIQHRREFGETLLEAEDISSKDGIVKNASVKVRSGEILGLFGLGGSGRTELLECIFGCRQMSGGTVRLNGKELILPTPKKSIDNGMVLICEDRRGKAMIGNLSVQDNILLSSIDAFANRGVLDAKAENASVGEQVSALKIKLAGTKQRMLELSGGNQQKVIFARTLMTSPRVFLCDEPTQAVDVGTRSEIHRLLRQKADEGAAVLFVSSDLKEVLEVADRVLVMSQGRTRECWLNDNLMPQRVLTSCYSPMGEEVRT